MSLIVQNKNFTNKDPWFDIIKKINNNLNENINNNLNENINNNLNENINLYFNLKCSDGHDYMNKETNNKSIFFAGSKNEYSQLNGYQFITINSLNPNLGIYNNSIKFNKVRFNYVSYRMTPYNKNYQYNNNEYILILLNNIYGWFSNHYSDNVKIEFNKNDDLYIDVKILNYKEKQKYILFKKAINMLIRNIRKYSNKKIIIRQHPKNRNIKLKSDEFNVDNNTNLDNLIDNCYCCFIQNTRLLFHLVNKGIPLFSLDYYTFNHFPEIYINLEDINNINNIKLPNRSKFLKKYYKFIHFKDELNNYNKFKKALMYYNII